MMTQKTNRYPRLKGGKVAGAKSLQYATDPYLAMGYLGMFGGLTSWQLCKLLFLNQPNDKGVIRAESSAKTDVNRKCLTILKKQGLVKVKPIGIPGKAPAYWGMNYLTESGRKDLEKHRKSHGQAIPSYRPPAKINEETINYHSLGIRDAGISAIVGARDNHLKVVTWMDDYLVRQMSKKGLINWPMEPDGVVVVEYGDIRRVFFIEVDRGTMSGDSDKPNSWKTKMGKYKQYFQSLRYDDKWFCDYPQPDLMVIAHSERRMENLMKVTGDVGGRSSYWFTTADFMEPPFNFFAQVWRRIALPGYYTPAKQFVLPEAS